MELKILNIIFISLCISNGVKSQSSIAGNEEHWSDDDSEQTLAEEIGKLLRLLENKSRMLKENIALPEEEDQDLVRARGQDFKPTREETFTREREQSKESADGDRQFTGGIQIHKEDGKGLKGDRAPLSESNNLERRFNTPGTKKKGSKKGSSNSAATTRNNNAPIVNKFSTLRQHNPPGVKEQPPKSDWQLLNDLIEHLPRISRSAVPGAPAYDSHVTQLRQHNTPGAQSQADSNSSNDNHKRANPVEYRMKSNHQQQAGGVPEYPLPEFPTSNRLRHPDSTPSDYPAGPISGPQPNRRYPTQRWIKPPIQKLSNLYAKSASGAENTGKSPSDFRAQEKWIDPPIH